MKALPLSDEYITTQYEVPPSSLQKFLNIFRRLFGLLIFGGIVVAETHMKQPYGLLTDSQAVQDQENERISKDEPK